MLKVPGIDIDVNATCFAFIVNIHVATLFPSTVVAVMATEPGAIALTSPVLETVAKLDLLVAHTTFLLLASAGKTVAVNCNVSPTTKSLVE